jgi:hypothetical protein
MLTDEKIINMLTDEKTMVRSPIADSVGQIWSSGLEVVKSKIASKGIGFWTMTGLFGLVGILSYMRKRDKRERELLMILLHEKDQVYLLHWVIKSNLLCWSDFFLIVSFWKRDIKE